MTLRQILACIAMVTAFAAALAVSPAGAPAALMAPNLREAAADFALRDANDSIVKLSDYKGKVVLLDFWATWCGACKIEIPWFIEFENEYKDSGLAVIGISMDEDGWTSVKPFLEKEKVNYPVVVGNEDLAKLYGVEVLPMTLLIGRDGRIASSHAGLVDKSVFESDIRRLLQENVKNAGQ